MKTVARHDGFAAWYDEHLARGVPEPQAGYGQPRRYSARLTLEHFEEHGDADYPPRVALRARRQG